MNFSQKNTAEQQCSSFVIIRGCSQCTVQTGYYVRSLEFFSSLYIPFTISPFLFGGKNHYYLLPAAIMLPPLMLLSALKRIENDGAELTLSKEIGSIWKY